MNLGIFRKWVDMVGLHRPWSNAAVSDNKADTTLIDGQQMLLKALAKMKMARPSAAVHCLAQTRTPFPLFPPNGQPGLLLAAKDRLAHRSCLVMLTRPCPVPA